MATNHELENRIECFIEQRNLIQTDLEAAREKKENTSAIWEAYNRIEEKIEKARDELKRSKRNTKSDGKVSYDNQTVISTSMVRRKDAQTLEIKAIPVMDNQNLQKQS